MITYDLSQAILIGLLLLFCLGNGISIIIQLVLAHRVRRMTRAILETIPCTGYLIPPDSIDPRAYDVASGRSEYIFIEERNDQYGERLIFVTKDGRHIRAMPWRIPSEASDY